MPCGTCHASWDDTQEVLDERKITCNDSWHHPYTPPGEPRVCNCGLPLVRNPHPDAGAPTMDILDIGYVWMCIPCTQKVLSAWSKRARVAEAAIRNHHRATTSPGCGNHHQTRDETLWATIGLSRFGDSWR